MRNANKKKDKSKGNVNREFLIPIITILMQGMFFSKILLCFAVDTWGWKLSNYRNIFLS